MTAVLEAPAAPRRRMLVGLLVNGGSRALLVATPAVTLPLVTDSLGTINYGAYAVVTAIVYFLPWADFGISLSMVTSVSQADGRGDRSGIRATVSTGLVMLAAIGGVLLTLAVLAWLLIDWRSVLGLAGPGVTADVPLAVFLVLASLAVGIPANLGMKVMLGLQMSRAFAFWQAASVPVILGAVVAGHVLGAGLPWFVLATVAPPNLVAVLASIWLFRRAAPDIAPRVALATRALLKPMLGLGSAFAVNAAAWAISYTTSNVVISHIVGAEAAGVFNVSQKLSSISFLVFESLLLPLWPMFGSRLAAGDFAGTRAGLRIATLVSAVCGLIAAVGFVRAAPPIIRVWLGAEYIPSMGLMVALAAFCFLEFVAQPFTLVLNGAGAKTFLLASATSMAIVTLPLSIVLTHAVGVSGPTWALVISMTTCILIPSAWAAVRRTRGPA